MNEQLKIWSHEKKIRCSQQNKERETDNSISLKSPEMEPIY